MSRGQLIRYVLLITMSGMNVEILALFDDLAVS
jgi:hypothetical protein